MGPTFKQYFPEVEEYVRRKGDNIDRWLLGMQRLRKRSVEDS